MAGHPEQVREQAPRFLGSGRDGGPHDAEGLHQDLLGLILVMEHGMGHAQEPWGGELHQLDQGLFVPCRDSVPQGLVPPGDRR